MQVVHRIVNLCQRLLASFVSHRVGANLIASSIGIVIWFTSGAHAQNTDTVRHSTIKVERREERSTGTLVKRLNTEPSETNYLIFQQMTGIFGYAGTSPHPGRLGLDKAQIADFVHDVLNRIQSTGDAQHKLGFAIGPICLSMSEQDARQYIRDAFAVAQENDVALVLHIDDSMTWSAQTELSSNPDNIETTDWKQTLNHGRRADWGPKPTRFPPQLCFNSPAVRDAVKKRAGLIGEEVKKQLDVLSASGKQHLFAGVIAGWETQIGRDFDTGSSLGYRALSHRGFDAQHPPKDLDAERVSVVKEFMELWANSLASTGVPREKIFCHIAFTPQGLRQDDPRNTYAQRVNFSVPDVAFSTAYRPGFSTYPEPKTFDAIYATLRQHGNPGWISAEGVNVSPTGMAGEATTESYLARMYNHGAVMVNLFAWGIGGEAMRDNFFRKAVENSEAISSYQKFLRGERLVETGPSAFSIEALQAKMHRIQKELPKWVRSTGRATEATALTQRIDAALKEKRFQDAAKAADELLALMSQ